MSNKKYKSISRVLKSKGKSCEEFEQMLSALSFEEIIALKLELSAKMTKGKLFGFPIWNLFRILPKRLCCCLLIQFQKQTMMRLQC